MIFFLQELDRPGIYFKPCRNTMFSDQNNRTLRGPTGLSQVL